MSQLPHIVIASRRDDGDWSDLHLCLHSLHLYAPNYPVTVAMRGPGHPWGYGKNQTVIQQPEGLDSFGAAYNWLVNYVDAESVILCNDDVILHPTTMWLLMEDVRAVVGSGVNAGYVASRVTYGRGFQVSPQPQPRSPIELHDVVSPVFAWIWKETFQLTKMPDINWFSDDVHCLDLKHFGYQNYLSRSLVYHIGERSTSQCVGPQAKLAAEGVRWLQKNRPDIASIVLKG
jgi:hypothetical protein